jgi:hypothetical protein
MFELISGKADFIVINAQIDTFRDDNYWVLLYYTDLKIYVVRCYSIDSKKIGEAVSEENTSFIKED